MEFLLLLAIACLQIATLYVVWPAPLPPPTPETPPVLPEDWDALIKLAFADCGLNTNLAHDVLAAVAKRANLPEVQTFGHLRSVMEKVARGC